MTEGKTAFLVRNRLAIRDLAALAARPAIFEPGEPLFWDDPFISAQMLKAHLDPGNDLASRKPETIDRTVDWLVQEMGLRPGDRVLDLGCGPGLYCSRLAARGLGVVGIDYSRRSIEYARRCAQESGPPVEYIYRNYLEIDYAGQFEAALLIYGDICTLSDRDRDTILTRVHKALVPGGYFAFDMMTPLHPGRYDGPSRWTVQEEGFWRSTPYLLLEQRVDYPEEDVYLARHIVIDEDGTLTDYRIWNRLYTAEGVCELAARFGFKVQGLWGDLMGSPYHPASEWLGVLVRKEGGEMPG